MRRTFDSLWAFGLVWSLIAIAMGYLNYFDWLTVKRDDRSLWFAEYFRHGFSSPDDKAMWPTYPVWGYGGMLAITANRTALLAIQAALALASILFLLNYVQSRSILSVRGVRFLKILVLLSVPLFAAHLVLWPNSYAISLNLISLVLLATALERSGADHNTSRMTWPIVILSALCYGLALNFRSDYWLFPVGAVPALLLLATPMRRAMAILGVWLLVVATCITPWIAYTHKACGHAVATSTNAGQVAYIGLGASPDNKWGITPDDNDPVLHHTIAKHFGRPRSPFDYDVDQYLKSEFIRLISTDPKEYTRKCVYALRSAIFSGAYVAKFYRQSDDDPVSIADLPGYQREVLRDPVLFVRTRGILLLTRLVATFANDKIARIVVPLGYVCAGVCIVRALRRREMLIVLGILAIGYQTAIMAFLNTIPMYMSNVYLWHLVLIAYAACGRRRIGSHQDALGK